MRSGKWYLLNITLLTIAIGSFLSTGCKRFDGIDNNNVVRTPYGVYFADNLGAMYNTNDGKAYKLIFPSDGVAPRAIAVSGMNLMWIKYNKALFKDSATLFLSQDNGGHFNPRVYTVNPKPLWQSQILDVPSFGNMYLASNKASSVEFSVDNGLTWQQETFGGLSGFSIKSFTQVSSGKLYGLDYQTLRLFEKTNTSNPWTETSANTPLPPGTWQLGHFNDVLVAADYNGVAGVYNSTNFGVDWQPYSGIPTGKKIFTVASPLNQVLLAGIENGGIYRLVGNTFQAANNGLTINTSVYSIAGKEEIYKNDVLKQYIYIATNTGLYRSEDLAQSWVLMRAGDFRCVY